MTEEPVINPMVSPVGSEPAAPSKDVFAQQLKRRKRSRVRQFFGVLGLLTAVGGVGVASYLNFTERGHDLVDTGWTAVQTAVTVHQNPDLVFDKAGSDHVNILLIGRDVDYKEVFSKGGRNLWHVANKDTRARSDSMIVMSLDKELGTIRMVSFPRDAMVHLPPNEFHVRHAKLNAAHAYGGPHLLKQTLHDELGVDIHHYAVIKFDGFKHLIDEVGGIWVNVDGALKRDKHTGKLYRGDCDYDDNWGNLHIHLKPGLQLLNGQKAHDYVRFRMDLEGDPGRIRRQQLVMRALAKQLMHTNPLKLASLIKEIRQQFETDMSNDEIGSAAYFAQKLGDPAKVQPLTLFGVYSTRGQLTLNRPKNKKLLAYVFGQTFTPENFLQHSPSTDEDEIGPTNNANPQAHQILVDAGIIKGQKSLARSAEIEAPVKSETDANAVSADAGNGASSHSSSESSTADHDTRLAVADPATENHPRRHRRSRRHTEASASTETATSEQPRHTRRSRTGRAKSHDESTSARHSEVRVLDQAAGPVPMPESDTTARHSSGSLSVESGSQ